MALDLVILGIPIPYYMKSSLTWRSRFSLMGLFILGLMINGIAVIRLAEIVDTRAGTYPTLDPSFYGTAQLVLASLEVSLAIIAASLPVFWPIMKFGLGSIFVTTVITVQHQDGNDVVEDDAKPYINPWSWDEKAETWKTETRDAPNVKTKREKTYEDMQALAVKPLPDLKTFIAARDEEEALVVTPLPDFRTWKMARGNRRSSSLYTSTVC
ncbi:hypothetical protein N0V82_000943 [Gnomoniopsis sp. IMI 355080]|nr:hypothetical protein N0V82_000943 [Gnomoniopsis sp. IMI 355080]